MTISKPAIQEVKSEAQTVLGELHQKIEAAGVLAATGDEDAIADLLGLRDELVSLASDFSGPATDSDQADTLVMS